MKFFLIKYVCLFKWPVLSIHKNQDSPWFRSCFSTTLVVCQVISQSLRLESEIPTHQSPPTLHPSPSIQAFSLSLVSLLCPFSLSFHIRLCTPRSITTLSLHPPPLVLIHLNSPSISFFHLSSTLPPPLSFLKCLNNNHWNLCWILVGA